MKLDRVIAVRNNKTVYRDGDACLKVFDESYSKADVLNEALNQARVEETGLCIPKVREVTGRQMDYRNRLHQGKNAGTHHAGGSGQHRDLPEPVC